MAGTTDVLVAGAGIAGMKASLLLAAAGRQVHLVENTSVIGGRIIRCEDIFPSMECATCMVSPMQQDILVNDLINVITMGSVLSIEGSQGNFNVKVFKKATCVDPVACIGCAECWNVCPVTIPNSFEENLNDRKAISVPCAGALPNVPWIDREHCLRWNGQEECNECAAACVFEAIDFSYQDSELNLNVSDIILATGYKPSNGDNLMSFGWGKSPGIFTAPEFERYYASNGPTNGELTTKDGKKPGSVAIIVHADGTGSFSHINTMYSLKFLHYFEEKLPDVKIQVFLDSSYSPGYAEDRYHERWQDISTDLISYKGTPEISSGSDENLITISCKTDNGDITTQAEMVVLGISMQPSKGTTEFLDMLELNRNDEGFISNPDSTHSSVLSSIPGILIAGCAGGPSDIPTSVTKAAAAVGRVLSSSNRMEE